MGKKTKSRNPKGRTQMLSNGKKKSVVKRPLNHELAISSRTNYFEDLLHLGSIQIQLSY